MKKLSKILILILAVALICTGLVLAVSADENEIEYTFDIASAVSAAEEGSTVVLTGNAQITGVVNVSKSITIDLNGYTIAATSDAFAIAANDITFGIVGIGNIDVAGTLVSAASNYSGFTVNINGAKNSEGIFVFHHDTESPIVNTTHGTFNMFNVNYVSTAVLPAYTAYFSTVTATNDAADREATGAWNLNAVSFKCDVNYVGAHGNFIVNLAGKGHLDIRNSALYSNNSGINAPCAYTGSGIVVDGVNVGAIYVYNSIISPLENDNTLTGRNYIISAHNKGFGDDLGFGGTVTFVDSVIESNSRLFHFTNKNPGIINFYGTTVRNAGSTVNTNPAYQYFRNVTASFYEGCRFVNNPSTSFVNSAFIKVAGVRTATTKSATLPSGMEWVYDPIGDSEAPYVAVASGTVIDQGCYIKNWNFESINFNTSAQNRNLFLGSVSAESTNTGNWQINNSNALEGFCNDGTGMQWHLKRGSLTHVVTHGSSYVRYWIEDDGDAETSTRLLTADPYLVTGLGYNLAKTSDGKYPTAMGGADRNCVLVNEFDFGTDSAYGYVNFNMVPMARMRNGTASQGNIGIRVDRNGLVTSSLTDARQITLNPAGQWNHASVVVYTDPVNSRAIAYMYINGQYIGYTPLNNTDQNSSLDNTVFQGTRLNIDKEAVQYENSSLCIDNVVLKAYKSYQFEGERDSSYTIDGDKIVYANDGVYYPEKYITSNPVHASMGNSAVIEVAGKHYSDLNSAIKYANELGVMIQLNGDINVPQTVTENAIVKTNGYKLPISSDSYGFVVEGDKYTFNEDYSYNAYWYNGDLSDPAALEDDSNYIKTVAKVGHELYHENVYALGSPDYTLLQIIAQDGWAREFGSEEKIEHLIPTLADLELAKADENRAIRFYPVITGIDMIYVVKNSEGVICNGGIDNESATAALKALANGDTLVLLSDVGLTESNLLFVSTADAPKVIGIDLNGNSIFRTVGGVMFQVGAYTTLNVYSSKAGGSVVATVASGASNGLSDGGTAFAINDGTNNSAWLAAKNLVSTRANVTEAYINVGKFGDIPGSNMIVAAERAYYGFKGGENCAITSDGVNIYAPGSASSCAIDSYVYDGNITFKNGIIYAPEKDNVVNAAGFSKDSKVGDAYPRLEGFESIIITADIRIENAIIVNRLSGISDGNNNNVVSNNGDDLYVTITFNNVVTTGRLNPSNANRNSMDGFVAAEVHSAVSNNPTANTITAICNIPMTWQSIDIGITESVLNFAIPAFNSTTGELVIVSSVNIASRGTSTEGLANAYVLPMLTGASIYKDDAVKVAWKGFGTNANAKTEYYVPGTPYVSVAAPTAAEYKLNAVKLVHDKNWNGIPAAGTVMNENINVVPGYKVESNISGIKANLSLYSDFIVNLYVPSAYAEYIKVNGNDITANSVTLGEASFVKAKVSKNAKEASSDAVFEITIAEAGYIATKTVNISIADYAAQILGGSYTDSDKILMYYMLNYASEAAKYFDENNTADEELEKLLADNAQWNVINVEKNFANAIENIGLDKIFTSSGITLGETPMFTFTPNGKFKGTVTVTYGDGNVRTFTVAEDSTAKLSVEGMKIYNFCTNLTVTAVGTVAGMDDEQTIVGTINFDTYAKYHTDNAANEESLTKDESIAALELINALYDYVKVAERYKAGTLTAPADN